MDIVTDAQIRAFIDEVKLLRPNFSPRLKDGIGKLSFEYEVIGLSGNTFKIIVRQSKINSLDFSVIFGVLLGGNLFRIRRYNGNSHTHMNKLEKEEIEGFHIHKATQKYQENGFKEEGYAEKTTRYSDWKNALDLMLKENNFEFEVDKEQRRLV